MPLTPELSTVDAASRVELPPEFAGAAVVIERVSATELRIRKADAVPEDELPLIENSLKPLSDRDRDLFLALLDSPPEPNEALKKALRLHQERHG